MDNGFVPQNLATDKVIVMYLFIYLFIPGLFNTTSRYFKLRIVGRLWFGK
jgi:hypothetical protein